jgi:hypothetical protein
MDSNQASRVFLVLVKALPGPSRSLAPQRMKKIAAPATDSSPTSQRRQDGNSLLKGITTFVLDHKALSFAKTREYRYRARRRMTFAFQ